MDGARHWAGDRDLGQLEGDGAGVARDTGSDFDQLELLVGQRPVYHGVGQIDAAQGGCAVVGKRGLLQPDLIASEPSA